MSNKQIIEMYIERLCNPKYPSNFSVEYAIDKLVGFGDQQVVTVLVDALWNNKDLSIDNAIKVLERVDLDHVSKDSQVLCLLLLGREDEVELLQEKAIPGLIKALTSHIWTVRLNAANMLGSYELTEEQFQQILNLTNHISSETKEGAVLALAKMDRIEAIVPLMEMLSSGQNMKANLIGEILNAIVSISQSVGFEEVKEFMQQQLDSQTSGSKRAKLKQNASRVIILVSTSIREKKKPLEQGVLSSGIPDPPSRKNRLFRVRRIIHA